VVVNVDGCRIPKQKEQEKVKKQKRLQIAEGDTRVTKRKEEGSGRFWTFVKVE